MTVAITWPRLLGLALLVGVGALLFAWSGLYNVAASVPHWRITDHLLRLGLESSVERHAAGIQPPPLDAAALIEKGAGHYETGCAPCHGAPGVPGHEVPGNMLPPPPDLAPLIANWATGELFWIVKNGIKYAGMPAWPAQNRDDEVWAVTAFLRKLPAMPPDDYARLAGRADLMARRGDAARTDPERPGELFPIAEPALVEACLRCHGADGVGRPSGAFPRLDIQSPAYLARALAEYAAGVRTSGVMQPIAAALGQPAIERLARHYGEAAGPVEANTPAPGSADLALGRRIATAGIPARRVAACAACHGLAEGALNPKFPSLNGQYAAFTATQLRLWNANRRGGGPYASVMGKALGAIGDAEIAAVAGFYASLQTARPAQAARAEVGGAGAPKE